MSEIKQEAPIDKVLYPIQRFIQQEKAGGIVLAISVIIAILLANSPYSDSYFHFFENKFGFQFNGSTFFEYDILHWINDGLMAVFFFVVGLELKREFIGGELSTPRKVVLPIVAALGGMIVPALIYLMLNPVGEAHSGWGIPMATDIAFALAVLYVLGNRIPLSLKIFLTALAIVDDLGAVLVVAFFYTSDISIINLVTGLGFAFIMFLGNKMGVRSFIFYAIVGILGVWGSFLVSGVHATIASVIAAFMIPADVKIRENVYVLKMQDYLEKFRAIDPADETPKLTNEQLHILETVKIDTNKAIPPLHRLEHAMHPFVNFVVLPVFALANAGVSFDFDPDLLFNTNVALGVFLGLLVGKTVGITAFTFLFVKLGIAPYPKGMNLRNLIGIGMLGSIGFTMSLFITSLAFSTEEYIIQAKVGIFSASIIGGLLGYFLLKRLGR